MAPTRPVLRWHGGKWKLAPWIISHFPAHRVYVEPFGGAASVLLRKERVETEIYNDLDAEVVNLFRVCREHTAALARAIALTPYSRDEYQLAYEATDDPVERARRLVARSFMGQSSKGAFQKSGFDTRVNPDAFISRLQSLVAVPDEIALVALRFSRVVIENDDALSVAARHDRPDALLYFDPPYLPELRPSGKVYTHDLDSRRHDQLLAMLPALSGMVVLSGYPSERYDSALVGWRRMEVEALADGARPRVEVLWINPACAAALEAQREQLEMFEAAE